MNVERENRRGSWRLWFTVALASFLPLYVLSSGPMLIVAPAPMHLFESDVIIGGMPVSRGMPIRLPSIGGRYSRWSGITSRIYAPLQWMNELMALGLEELAGDRVGDERLLQALAYKTMIPCHANGTCFTRSAKH